MKNYLIAARYANALNRGIENDGELEEAAKALSELGEVFESSRDLQNALTSPTVPSEARTQILAQTLDTLESVPRVRKLADAMLRRGRITLLTDVAEIFWTQVDKRLNRINAHVTTALEITEDQRSRMQTALERYSGKTVRMQTETDAEILGGAVTRLGDEIIDGSVRMRLEQLRTALLKDEEVGVIE